MSEDKLGKRVQDGDEKRVRAMSSDEREELNIKILEVMNGACCKQWRPKHIAKVFKINVRTIASLLSELAEEGKIIIHRKGVEVYYVIEDYEPTPTALNGEAESASLI